MRALRAIFLSMVLLGLMLPATLPTNAAPPPHTPHHVSRFTFQNPFQNQPGVTMTASAGFGEEGSYSIGRWFPVRVTLDNPAGAGDKRVRVEVNLLGNSGSSSPLGVYARDVDLPSPSRKEVTLYTFASNFSHAMAVRLSQGGTIIATANIKLDPHEPVNSAIVGVVSSDSSLLNLYEGEQVGNPEQAPFSSQWGAPPATNQEAARAAIAHVAPEHIPPLASGLNSLAALVMDDVETGAFSQEQRDAIASWVAQGGTLVVTTRPGGADTLAGFADILPVSASGTRNLSGLNGLSDLVATPLEASGPFLVPEAKLRADIVGAPRLLAAQEGVPLVAMRDLGRGQVVYLAVSPGVEPLKGWDGTVPLVKRLLAEHPVRLGIEAAQYGMPTAIFDTYGSIFDLPGLDLPEPLLIAAFMFIYILLVGPINYMVLKRMRRAELAWVTIPIMVVIFAAIAYIIGLQSKGGELLTIRGNVVHTTPGLTTARTQQYLGVFSPIRRTYRLQAGSESLASEISPYDYDYGSSSGSSKPPVVLASASSTTIEDVNVDTWSLRSFMAESTVRAESPLEANLRMADNRIVGTVRNRSENGLQDVALIRGRAVQYVGYLAPGGEAPVDLELSQAPFNNSSPVSLLPLPTGVEDPTQSGGYGYYGSGESDSAQRNYNRRVQMLSTALEPLLTNERPTDFTVLAIAWGPPPPSEFRVLDRSTRNEDLNVWTSRLQVTGAAGDQGRATNRTLPVMQYVPGDNPAWQAFNVTSVRFSPFTGVQFRLPPGTQPGSLTLEYETQGSVADNPVVVRAFNVRTGAWDELVVIANASSERVSVPIRNPGDYTGPGGDVTLRLAPAPGSSSTGIGFDMFTLLLNESETQ